MALLSSKFLLVLRELDFLFWETRESPSQAPISCGENFLVYLLNDQLNGENQRISGWWGHQTTGMLFSEIGLFTMVAPFKGGSAIFMDLFCFDILHSLQANAVEILFKI